MPSKLKSLEPWQQNLAVLWLGTFIAGMGFSEVSPFISLYVDQLGDFTKGQLSIYSGITFGVTFMVVAIVSPLWGRLADRRGRKLMLLRSSFGMAIIIGACGFVHNVYALIALRFLQGLAAGYIPNASALIATETPKAKSGTAIGILTTGYVSGNLIGPILGGFLAQTFSIRLTFIITGVLLLIVFVLSLTMVHEHYTPDPRLLNKEKRPSLLSQVNNPKAIMVLLVSTAVIQLGNMSIYPIISLYVKGVDAQCWSNYRCCRRHCSFARDFQPHRGTAPRSAWRSHRLRQDSGQWLDFRGHYVHSSRHCRQHLGPRFLASHDRRFGWRAFSNNSNASV
ncbi:transportation protein [Lacticaseibacillus paracasei]|nr:transportation protein [Lacticaseibacillus paracasei]